MNTIRSHTHHLRRARAHFTVLALLGAGAIAGAVAPALHAAPADRDNGSEAARRPAPRGKLPPGPPRPPGPLALFDADHDGIISAEEIAAAPDALRKLDTNGDGQLTRDELTPPRPPRPPSGPDDAPDGPPPGGRGPGAPRPDRRGPDDLGPPPPPDAPAP